MNTPQNPRSYFANPFGDEMWIFVPSELSDKQTYEAAQSVGVEISEIERVRYPQPVAFFNGSFQQWEALYCAFKQLAVKKQSTAFPQM